ncbi:hypothetical protein [Streptomyces sp. NPDC046197]|uniref:hypothetical protein n=1 Tax=Streptomyces sp. NPDC046197 TaxID=3154337 RepID=UPI0033FE38AC
MAHRARGAADALADDCYGDGVRAAILRLEFRLGEEDGLGGETRRPPGQRL